MVASSQNLATQVGLDVLRNGGSAVDAAIATNAMLSLVEPHMCGPGGDLFAIVWDPRDKALVGLNASGRSPAELSYSSLKEQLGGADTMPGRGPLAFTMPGAVDGWCALHERFGRLPFAELFQPVIEHARQGVVIGKRTAEAWADAVKGVVDDPVLAKLTGPFSQTFEIKGASPRMGQVFCNPDLAATYVAIGQGGRRAFYEGDGARSVVEYLRSIGSVVTEQDLLGSHCEWVAPLTTSYRGHDVFELPPNGQGLSVLQILNILEAYPLRDFGPNSADYWHVFIEAKKLCFEDRARYYADPEFSDIPTKTLIDKSYAERRRALINNQVAASKFSHGDVAVPGSDTTYLCAADSDGMMVSLIQSIFSPFGSGLVPPGSGYALQCRGAGFSLGRDHPNCYAPKKRPFHTIIPAFVMKDGKPWLSFGVMGADMQPQGQVQVLVNMIDFDMDPQAAGDAARMRHFGGRQPNGQCLDGLGIVQYEPEFDGSLIEELQRRGHKMQEIEDWISGFVGGYQAICYDSHEQVYVAGSEPRLDGCALGY
ncbi:MAG: gamma-glutamyltranspeptidase/glutathione hydrolase [Gammaproteobacteria bacterium]|jgi:gamma-glutamyltranspeptidase/glutathione hydrolase